MTWLKIGKTCIITCEEFQEFALLWWNNCETMHANYLFSSEIQEDYTLISSE